MNSRYQPIIRNFHYYYCSNSILRTKIVNSLGLKSTLYGFVKNKNNNLDTLNREHLYLIDTNNIKINRNFNKIIDLENKKNQKLEIPPKNFIWFYKNCINLQFYNQYIRDMNGFLHQIQPDKKDYIKFLLNII